MHHICFKTGPANSKTKDLKSDNLLLGFEDRSVITDYVGQQKANPPQFKEVNGHPIYQSQPDFGGLRKGVGLLKISDFGAAVFGNVPTPHCHEIQPEQFCAPEVLLKATWTYSADILNLGMVVSDFRYEEIHSRNAANLIFLPSYGSFCRIFHSSMGSGRRATYTLAKSI
jgi:serine/threonine protein kinase